jgi:diguanylate cyclase (GGDEF)-like protein
MSSGNLHILLVEDDQELMRLVRGWLESAGYSVVCAADGEQAMAAIQESCPDIVVTDSQIPHVDGVDLCRWIRTQPLPHHVYAILMNSLAGPGGIVQALESGADDTLKKPLHKDELLARVRSGVRLVELERRFSRIAGSDALTELATRRTFFEMADRQWKQDTPMSCVMIDIDYFKRINDTLGHAVGDATLRGIAGILREACGPDDLIARYGGEEFCVLLPETSESDAIAWADRVRTRIAASSDLIAGTTVHVTASFGVTQRTMDAESLEQFIDKADQALLVAKRSGRDRVIGFKAMKAGVVVPVQRDGPATAFQGLTAKQVMTTIVAPLSQEDTVGRAARYFVRFRFHSAPVVDDYGLLVGMLSERDVMAIMLGPKWWSIKIKDIMRPNVVAYEEDELVLVIYDFLSRVLVRGVVIVKNGRPTGLINRTSLLRWFTNRLRPLANEPEDTSDRPSPAFVPDANIHMIMQAIAEEASELERKFESEQDAHLPLIIGGVSKIEELLNDLLSYSRGATQPPISGSSDPFGLTDEGTGFADHQVYTE